MKKISPESQLLPEQKLLRIVCGVFVSEWNYSVVYIRNPNCDNKTTQKFYFTFYASGNYYLNEVATYVEQWTYRRGDSINFYPVGSHEYYRARKMAIMSVGTFRRNYLRSYGSEPNPLMIRGTLDDCLNPTMRKRLLKKLDLNEFTQLTLPIEIKRL